ncbi:hypothetical protein [Nostoc sp.]|uniref:hypothetical protein n=1 Tax=Nostoc sp. TaxID=1180 RepID=UPI002FF9BA08
MKISDYHVITPPFFDELEQRIKRVIFATRTANIRIIDDHTWSLLEAGQFEQFSQDILFDFVDIELIVPAYEDELKTILARNDAAKLDDDVLSLVVQPTAFCQLGCHYCGQEHTSKMMSEDDQKRFLERTRVKLETQKFHSLSVS